MELLSILLYEMKRSELTHTVQFTKVYHREKLDRTVQDVLGRCLDSTGWCREVTHLKVPLIYIEILYISVALLELTKHRSDTCTSKTFGP